MALTLLYHMEIVIRLVSRCLGCHVCAVCAQCNYLAVQLKQAHTVCGTCEITLFWSVILPLVSALVLIVWIYTFVTRS